MSRPQTTTYKGVRYLVDIRGYYRAAGWNATTKETEHSYLHRLVWEENYGSIPEGYHIHHKDGNRLNNDIRNLECISPSEHSRKHYGLSEFNSDIEKLAERNRKSYEKAPEITKKCLQCGKEFTYKCMDSNLGKFCSPKCRSYYGRVTDARYNTTVVCAICGKEFETWKYHPSKTCGKECWKIYQSKKKKGEI